MSRSHRKTPIIANTTCNSERQDKKQWHSVFRSRERGLLKSTSIDALEAHLSITENQESNPWSMGKDGRRYWSIQSRKAWAATKAERDGDTPNEQEALKKRMLHKWMGK